MGLFKVSVIEVSTDISWTRERRLSVYEGHLLCVHCAQGWVPVVLFETSRPVTTEVGPGDSVYSPDRYI